MIKSAIQYLSTSRSSQLLAAGFWEKTVQIWDLERREQIGQFDTIASASKNRLDLDPSGQRGVVASWVAGARGGAACYEIPTGKTIWHRTDLRHSQNMFFSPDGGGVWFEPEEGRIERLDPLTGKTVDTLIGMKHIYLSAYSAEVFLERRKGDYILRGNRDFAVPRLAFAILDVAFGPESLCVSESGGPVRCLDCNLGVERWRYQPSKNNHILRLWYREMDTHFYGVLWEYHHGKPRTLVRFDKESGEPSAICSLDSWEEEVCNGLDCLITSKGEMLALSDGKLLGRLTFPQKDYPDTSITSAKPAP